MTAVEESDCGRHIMKIGAFNPKNAFRAETPSRESTESLILFEGLAVPLLNPLYSFARWLTRNREEAEDLVQETYLKAWQGFSAFQLGTNFRAWIHRILPNTFLSSRTGSKTSMTMSLDSCADGIELSTRPRHLLGRCERRPRRL